MSRTQQLITLLALLFIAFVAAEDSSCKNAFECFELAVKNLQKAEKEYLNAVSNIQSTLQLYTSFFNATIATLSNTISQIGAKQYSTTYQSLVLSANTNNPGAFNVPPPPGATYDMTLPDMTPNNRVVATWWVLEHNIADLSKFNFITTQPATNPWQINLAVAQTPGLVNGGLLRIGIYALYV